MKGLSSSCLQTILLLSSLALAHGQQSFWQRIGPYGGTATNLIILSNGDILAGGTGAYHYRSTDNGESWTKYGPHPHVLSSDGTLYGTGYRDVYRSTNNGYSWTDLTQGILPLHGANVLATDSIGQVIIVGGGRDPRATSEIAFRSTDSGRTWQDVLFADRTSGNTSVLRIYRTPKGNFLLSCEDNGTGLSKPHGIYRSPSDGGSWRFLDNELMPYSVLCFANGVDSAVLCGTDSGGIFRSTDDGVTWSSFGKKGLPMAAVNAIYTDAAFDLWAGTGEGIFRWNGAVDTWEERSMGLTSKVITAIVKKGHADTLFAGAHGEAVFRSTDNGLSWEQKANGWNQIYTRSIATIPGYVFAGTEYGILRFSEQTGLWHALNPAIRNSSIFPNLQDTTLFACNGKWIYRSTDAGESWKSAYLEFANEIISMTFESSTLIYAADFGYGVFKSTDGGETWMKITDIHGPDAIFAAPTGSIFLASRYDTLYRSDDGGQSWDGASRGISSRGIRTFASNSKGDIFSGGGGVFRTNDNGESWVKTVNGMTNMNISEIAINQSNCIFAATSYGHAGIFMSTNDGDSWRQINDGLSFLNVYGITLNVDGFLYANTRYEGVFRSMQSTLTYVRNNRSESIATYALLHNFPNPFNSTTIIEYEIARPTYVALKVYNMLGQQIASLVDELQQAGKKRVRFNRGNLPSGLYIYRLTAGNFTDTKKMMLIK